MLEIAVLLFSGQHVMTQHKLISVWNSGHERLKLLVATSATQNFTANELFPDGTAQLAETNFWSWSGFWSWSSIWQRDGVIPWLSCCDFLFQNTKQHGVFVWVDLRRVLSVIVFEKHTNALSPAVICNLLNQNDDSSTAPTCRAPH